MQKMSAEEIRLHVLGVIVLLIAMFAIGMLSEISRQNWDSKVSAYPTKTEEAIESYARELLAEMTLEQKVGQMFFASDGVDAETAAEYGLGGVFFGAGQLGGLTKSDVIAILRAYEAESEIPMFVGVGEEGGTTVTVSGNPDLRPRSFLSPRELITTGGLSLVETDTAEKSDFLRELGFNMNFAPVCDVVTETTALMYDRAAPGDADDVARYAETVVKTMTDRRIIAVLKYFPGYGDQRSVGDAVIPRDKRTVEELNAVALQPFIRAINGGAEAVLMGNAIVTAVDDALPAVLSREVHNLLRRELGFDGLIISGNLHTEGMKQYGDSRALAVRAIQAGSDMLLTNDYAEQIDGVVRAVKAGTISVERIDESVLRILQLKIKFGMVE